MKRIILFAFLIAIALLPSKTDAAQGASRDVVLVKKSIQNNYYAILVGVEDYISDKIPDLPYCEDDVSDMSDILSQSGYEKSNITQITGIKASQENIIDAIKNLKNRTLYPAPDTIFFYFSGHGMAVGRVNYLIPFDGTSDVNKARNKNVSIDEVIAGLEASGFPRRIAVIDACRNDPEGKAVGGNWAGGFYDISEKYKNAKGTKIILSCEFGKKSWDDDDAQNGAFTSMLMEGLKTGEAKEPDGVVTVGSLEKYLFDKMAWYSRQPGNNEQAPITMGEGSSMIPVAVVEGGGSGNNHHPSKPDDSTIIKKWLKIKVEVENPIEGFSYSINPKEIDVEVQGTASAIDEIKDLSIKLNVNRVGEGTRNINIESFIESFKSNEEFQKYKVDIITLSQKNITVIVKGPDISTEIRRSVVIIGVNEPIKDKKGNSIKVYYDPVSCDIELSGTESQLLGAQIFHINLDLSSMTSEGTFYLKLNKNEVEMVMMPIIVTGETLRAPSKPEVISITPDKVKVVVFKV